MLTHQTVALKEESALSHRDSLTKPSSDNKTRGDVVVGKVTSDYRETANPSGKLSGMLLLKLSF